MIKSNNSKIYFNIKYYKENINIHFFIYYRVYVVREISLMHNEKF